MKNKKRILHLTTSLKLGGAEAVLFSLCTSLAGEFDQCVVSFYDGFYASELRAHGIQVHIISHRFFRYDLAATRDLFRIIKAYKPDLIHSMLWSANIYARICAWVSRVPSISVMHLNPDHGYTRNMIDRISLLFPTSLVAVSDGVAHDFAVRDRWLPARAVRVIHNGIDAERVVVQSEAQQKTRASVGLCDSHFVIGSVGRFNPQKNYPLLLRSFVSVRARYADARLMLVGHGEQEQFLRKYAGELGIEDSVIFVVGQPAYGYLPLFDCFTLSSDQEGLSIALLEAMSLGLPCVVTHDHIHAPHPVIIDGLNGIIVPVRDEDALAGALASLVEKRDFGAQMGKNGLQAVQERWSLQAMVNAYHALFISQTSK